MGQYVTFERTLYNLLFEQKVVAAPIYFHVFCLFEFLEEAFIGNKIIVICINNNNAVNANNYRRLQDLTSFFKISMVGEIISSKCIDNLGTRPQKRSPVLTYNQSALLKFIINPYPTAFPYGNGMVLHFYQQQESSTTKTVHKVINKRLKAYV